MVMLEYWYLPIGLGALIAFAVWLRSIGRYNDVDGMVILRVPTDILKERQTLTSEEIKRYSLPPGTEVTLPPPDSLG